MSSPSLAQRERHALCDTALELGPVAPTLCEGWDVHNLVDHLVLREGHLLAAAGMVLPFLSGYTERAMDTMRGKDFTPQIERLLEPGYTPVRIGAVDRAINTSEYFIHHEDMRRAQPGWTRRVLSPADETSLWGTLKFLGKMSARRAGVPMVVRRSDTGDSLVLRKGEQPVVITGLPSELALFLAGRQQVVGLTFDGPSEAVSRLQAADLRV